MKKLFIDGIIDESIQLPADTAHHLFHVLRHSKEEPFIVSNHEGHTGEYVLDSEESDIYMAKRLRIIDVSTVATKVVLIQSFLKGDKFEFLLQKATELNVHHIYGVSSVHCVAKYDAKKLSTKKSRWEKIIVEASQQCGRPDVPTLTVEQTLSEVLQTLQSDEGVLLLGAYEREDDKTIKDILQTQLHTNSYHTIAICIGPEGGYSANEMELLESCGGYKVSLGPTILRAETAALGAVSMIQYELLD
ncbi:MULTISPECIES: 16S rRNA (uracil(1498)-N(3))-methyltransferase [unclassified Veillonella]|uniref:RsmE family RNA methyltransferase n=1 Tax=unclassified Veillonella TaxID=2630086 RepID=UPI000F8F7198|nr:MULTISPECIES: RsmE family RNA methyltransferase [unclassified Veillonella]